jgi:hypothetical protein
MIVLRLLTATNLAKRSLKIVKCQDCPSKDYKELKEESGGYIGIGVIIDNSAILVSYKLNSPKQKFRKK